MKPDQRLTVFEAERPRLQSLAYRMTGSLGDAEDIVQEAWLRLGGQDRTAIRDETRWLTTVTARLCLDHLRQTRIRRKQYVGAWLPDPLVADMAPDAELLVSHAQDIGIALLLTLQTLSPPMQAAFILREAFDFSYTEIAAVTGTTKASARQLVSRARKQMAGATPTTTRQIDADRDLVQAFWRASRSGDITALVALFADEIEVYTDGGGKVPAALNILRGTWRAASLFAGLARKSDAPLRPCPPVVAINGSPGFVSIEHGGVLQTTALAIHLDRINAVWIVRNPEKLAHIRSPAALHAIMPAPP